MKTNLKVLCLVVKGGLQKSGEFVWAVDWMDRKGRATALRITVNATHIFFRSTQTKFVFLVRHSGCAAETSAVDVRWAIVNFVDTWCTRLPQSINRVHEGRDHLNVPILHE